MNRYVRITMAVIVAILLTVYGGFCVDAGECEYGENDFFVLETEDILPGEITDVMNDGEIGVDDNLWDILINILISNNYNDNAIALFSELSTMVLFIIFVSVVSRVLISVNQRICAILMKLSIIFYVIIKYKGVLSTACYVINNISDLLSTLPVSLSTIFLISGSAYSSVASSSSLAILLTVFESVFLKFLSPLSLMVFAVFVAENVYEPLKAYGITKSFKKNLVSILIFSFSFLLAVIALNGSLAASKDSTKLRGLKFAMANVIPLIGNSAGEALKTLTAEAAGLRSTLGLASFYAILYVMLPPLIYLLLQKLTLRFGGVLSSLLCSSETSSIFDGAADILDIFIAILTSVMFSSLFTLFVFTNSIPI